MAEPIRKLITNNLETSLEAIKAGALTGNGTDVYRLTVCKVEQLLRHWGNVTTAERPWVGFMPNLETYEHQPFGCIRVVMPVTIMGYIHSQDNEIRQQQINRLMDDLVAALNADHTRGGNAMTTLIRTVRTDEGDPEGDGIVRIEADIIYFRTTGVS